MTAPRFYLVSDGNAYAIDDDGSVFGAPVLVDGTVEWDAAYDFDPCDEDIELVAHMCNLVKQAADLQQEHDLQTYAMFIK